MSLVAAGGAVWRFRRDGAESAVTIRTRLSFTSAEGVREGVLAGLGITTASRWMFAAELEAGTVTPLLEGWSLSPVDLWAVYPAGRLPSTKARAFATWLSEQVGGP